MTTKEVQEQIKGDILHFRKDTKEKIKKSMEKGKSYVEDVKKKVTSTIEEGKKKLKKKKEKPLKE